MHALQLHEYTPACAYGVTRRYYIDLGLENAIRSFFEDPEWCRQRGASTSRIQGEGSWWGGTEVARLRNEAPYLQVDDPDTSGYELMVDWLEPFKSVAYSVGVVGVRCADIDPRNKVRTAAAADHACSWSSISFALG